MGSSLSGTSATCVSGREISMLSVSTMVVWKTSDVSLLLPRMIKMIPLAFWINRSHAPPKCGPYGGLNFQTVFFIRNSEAMRWLSRLRTHRFNSSFAPTNVLPLSLRISFGWQLRDAKPRRALRKVSVFKSGHASRCAACVTTHVKMRP